MDVTVQIFCGSFSGAPVPFELIEQKLNSLLTRFRIRKVIMGWSTDKGLYEKTAELLSKNNIEFYLWFPVFSETGMLTDLSPLVDYSGKNIEKNGEYQESHQIFPGSLSEEDFFFCCPNNGANIKKIIDIYKKYFSSIRFNGVFLDKIRYPSFSGSHGNRSVFSCFCPECMEIYKKENFDINKLKSHLYDQDASLLSISKYSGGGKYIFQNKVMSSFFQIKKNIIYYSLQKICMYFREKKLGIGFDVFAPFLSPFTGQDLKKLSGLCDFIKPMMYRMTNAPAGLPFETDALLQFTCSADPLVYQYFYKLLGIKTELLPLEKDIPLTDGVLPVTGAHDIKLKSNVIKNIPFDLDFSVRELQDLTLDSFCPVYAGIEINRIKDIAETDPPYIEETIRAFSKTGVRGFVLSWNLLDMPEENIAKAAELI